MDILSDFDETSFKLKLKIYKRKNMFANGGARFPRHPSPKIQKS